MRARLAAGELGLDLYDMREALAAKGLTYRDAGRTERCSPAFPARSCAAERRKDSISTPAICRADRELRDRVLLAAMGSPDARQIDGVGGAHPLTSKVAVISRSAQATTRTSTIYSCRSWWTGPKSATARTAATSSPASGPGPSRTGWCRSRDRRRPCASTW